MHRKLWMVKLLVWGLFSLCTKLSEMPDCQVVDYRNSTVFQNWALPNMHTYWTSRQQARRRLVNQKVANMINQLINWLINKNTTLSGKPSPTLMGNKNFSTTDTGHSIKLYINNNSEVFKFIQDSTCTLFSSWNQRRSATVPRKRYHYVMSPQYLCKEWSSKLSCILHLGYFRQWTMSNMMFVDPCIIVQFIKKNPTRCNNVSKFYYSIFIWSSTCFGWHTAHEQEPKTALAASGLVFHKWKVVRHVIGGYCQAHWAWQRPPTTHLTTFHVWKTGGCQCSFRLLIMGGVSPETCWASYK